MSDPSSTSSSEQPAGIARAIGLSLVWCAIGLGVVRLGFALAEPPWPGRSDVAELTAFLQDPQADDLRTIAFGSSRLQGGFAPKMWARFADLEEEQVLSATLRGGTHFDVLHLLREGGLPAKVETVILDAPSSSFNRNFRVPLAEEARGMPNHLRQYGSLSDRLAADRFSERVQLLFEAAWPLYQRRALGDWIALGLADDPGPPERPDHPHYWHRRRPDTRLSIDDVARSHFWEPEISTFAVRNFEAVMAHLRAADVDVVIVNVPARAGYLELARSSETGRTFLEQTRALVRAQEGDRVRLLLWEDAAELGLEDQYYVDYGHLNGRGARLFTERLFEAIEGEGRADAPDGS